jgi:benzoyl-CoA 2,3-dioxygenase component B
VIERTVQAMKDAGISDADDIDAVRALGVIDLPTIQKKMNLHFSLTLDLFGNEISTNAANAFNAGIKGRYREDKLDDDHSLIDATYPVLRFIGGQVVEEEVPALSALNLRLRNDYVQDCASGVTRWNRVIEKSGLAFRLALPHVAFNRQIGEFSSIQTDPQGKVLSREAWVAARHEFLPSDSDASYIESLMVPVTEPGQYAGWIAAPKVGIDNKPGDFEYVQIVE